MASTVRALSSKILTEFQLSKVLQQRQWLQKLVSGFTINSNSEETGICSPVVLPYGSIVSGTSFSDADADYVIAFASKNKLTKSMNTVSILRENQENVLSDLFDHIRDRNTSTELRPQRIFRARVPIVQYSCKIKDEEFKFDVSLSIDGLRNSLLLREYMRSDARLRLGVLCAKQWGREQKILNARRGWISPYALTIMYIYYMKTATRTHVSISEDLINSLVDSILIESLDENNDMSLRKEFTALLPLEEVKFDTVHDDVYDFFDFYANSERFDLDASVVDIRSVGSYSAKEEWMEALQGVSDDDRWHLLGHECLLIRDPFEPHSLGRSVDFFRTEEIREKFRMGAIRRDPLSFLCSS